MTNVISGIVNMLQNHWIWGLITLACLVWYSSVTVYVAVKGIGDIRHMLRKLSERRSPESDPLS